jgi:FAD/FMN-containing dehydrogenase
MSSMELEPQPEALVAPDAVIDELRSAQLELVLPSDGAAFEQARRVWNADIDRRPAVIVRCRSSQDVALAIRCCVSYRVDCTVRGGGHNVAGSAVHDGAVLLDLSQLSAVDLLHNGDRVIVGGGATWAAVDAATAAVSRAVPAGLISHTGVGGLTLGGGVGWLSRHAGLTCDSLVSAEVVTASGDVLTASEDQHSDLFWALHGGGGNFGVVTQFVFRTTAVSAVRVRQYLLRHKSMHSYQ